MTGVIGSYPEKFTLRLIRALEHSPSKKVDHKIYTMIVEKNLFDEFTDWIGENPKWAKRHLGLVHDLVMLSLVQGNIEGIIVIEEIVRSIWGSTASAKWQLSGDVIRAIHQDNKLQLCVALFNYVETISFADFTIVQAAFGKLSEEERVGFVKLANSYQQNLFHICAEKNKAEVFDLFFEVLPSPDILNDEHSYRRGPLRIAIKEARNPAMVKKMLQAFDKPQRMEIIKTLLTGSRVLQRCMRTDNGVRIIKAVLQSFSKNDRSEVLDVRDSDDATILDFAVIHDFPKAATEVVRALPLKQRFAILQKSSHKLLPPLHLAAALGQGDLINEISSLLSKADRVRIRLFCDKKGKNLLHHAVCSKNNHLIKVILDPVCSPAKLKELVLEMDHQGKTSLHEAAIRIRAQAMKILLEQIPFQERTAGLERLDSQGHSSMYYALMNGNTALNKAIVDQVPLECNQKFAKLAEELMQEHLQSAGTILVGIKSVIPNLIPHLIPRFIVYEFYQSNTIHLLGRNFDSLAQMHSVIVDYTHKVDPAVKEIKCKIKKVKNVDDLAEGYTHYINIDHILPRPVRAFYGKNTPRITRNCHGAAAVASGIYPQMDHYEKPNELRLVKAHTTKVPLKQLTTGDWIYLKRGPVGTKFPGSQGAHSFVYLNRDLSLSMNGKNTDLALYTTSSILNSYGYPADVLYTTDPAADNLKKDITVMRKNPDWTYPDVQTPYTW